MPGSVIRSSDIKRSVIKKSVALSAVADADLPRSDIKLVLFDIDGTLLGLDGHYSPATAREIARIQSLGIKTAVASGRPYFAAHYLVEELKLDAAGSFCTGVHLHEPASGRDIAVNGLPRELSLALLDALRASDLHYELYTADDYYIEERRRPNLADTHAYHLRRSAQQRDFAELIAEQPVIKWLAAVDNEAEHDKLYALERQFPQLQFACASVAAHPDWLFASIVDQSACKVRAFERLLAHHQLGAENVMSFGDAQSDMVFLQQAGTGVAMGNAKDEVKACANFVTRAVWDDGIAYALARLIPAV